MELGHGGNPPLFFYFSAVNHLESAFSKEKSIRYRGLLPVNFVSPFQPQHAVTTLRPFHNTCPETATTIHNTCPEAATVAVGNNEYRL